MMQNMLLINSFMELPTELNFEQPHIFIFPFNILYLGLLFYFCQNFICFKRFFFINSGALRFSYLCSSNVNSFLRLFPILFLNAFRVFLVPPKIT